MYKAFTKRFRVTRTGKILRRKMAQTHFRAKKSGKQIRNKRRGLPLKSMNAKVFKKYII